jgi:hypothetical protein
MIKNSKSISKKIELDGEYIKTIEHASKLVTKVANQLNVVKYNINKMIAQETPEARGYFRLRLEAVLVNLSDNCEELLKLKSNKVVNRVLSQYYNKTVDIDNILKVSSISRDLLNLYKKSPHTMSLKKDLDESFLAEVKKVQASIMGLFPS